MINWLLISKTCIVFFSISMYFNINIIKSSFVVLFILVYIVLNIAMYLFKDDKLIKAIELISLVLCITGMVYVDKLFLLLLIFNIYEITERFDKEKWSGLLINVILGISFAEQIFEVYMFISFISFIIFKSCTYYNKKINYYNELLYNLRMKNNELNKALSKELDYQNQIEYTSKIEERNKIAQEIHDNIGHTISGTLMQLEAAKYIIEKDTSASKNMIQNSIDVLREGMESIRATLRNIKPPKEQLGINTLKLTLNKIENSSGITTNLIYDNNVDKIKYHQWKIIKTNIKEILTNTIKYSGASNVTISFRGLNKMIKVEIKDNGIGCGRINKGLGLTGIEERCGNINAKVIFDGSDGFSVIMLLPIEGVD
ncbi:sensor histidine kinase [Clostridium sediminicola]|uniref:sensor histidine kinase n=1 Tax=Clostridium sediminicola TaxID=3114879 RepID=UPI003D1803CC